ncbi:unnamed protein product [Phytomonas sp. Hart1]|nr:unnamed protein product [Phytomonas sp. Hart1]|eukprot:CCW70613.1 unnamed protein product [Phytomonas sp. isolate Hart1]
MPSSIGEVSLAVCQVAEGLRSLKRAYDAQDDARCRELLAALQTRLIALPTFLNPTAASPSRGEELHLAREVLELGVLVSARGKDLAAFDRHFAQLQVYDEAGPPADPPRRATLLGLNLLRLLVGSRVAQFHAELERLPAGPIAASPAVRFAAQLERYLMEGSYNKLLTARRQAPANEFLPVVEMLESTVRAEVANCIPHAYHELSIAAAQTILMLRSPNEVRAIGREHGWNLAPDGKGFVFIREEDIAKKEIPFKEMINEHIQFAAELQKIV